MHITSPEPRARTRRKAAAALLLALPLLLTACGGDDDSSAPARQAYTPSAETASSAPAEDAASASPSSSEAEAEAESSEPQDAESTQASDAEDDASTPAEEPTEDAPSPAEEETAAEDTSDDAAAVDCSGREFQLTDVTDLTCAQALGMLDPFVTSGQEGGRITDVECSVGRGEFDGQEHDEWTCSRDAGGSFVGYRTAASAENAADSAQSEAAVDCEGQQFLLTEVSDLTCAQALGMLDPFVTSGQDGGRITDVACSVGRGEFDGRERDEWACSRDAGGSFVAYAK